MKELYDVIIIGTGPAGLMAGIYAARYKLKTLIIGRLHGGMISEAVEIMNFPTHERISGAELTEKMMGQAEKLGVNVFQDEVINIKTGKEFTVMTDKHEIKAKKIILATGMKKKKLNIPGEERLLGKGVSYCATCDAGFFKNKVVAVIGGGNTAVKSALLIAKYARKVYIIYHREQFDKVEPLIADKAKKEKKISVMLNSEVMGIDGKEKVENITVSGKKIKVDGVFIKAGSVPDDYLIKKLKLKTINERVVVDKNHRTNVRGVFAAGDITDNPLNQAITAAAEGAIAAYSVYEELSEEK